MNDLSNEVFYLKGFAEGLKISDKSDEGNIITKLIDTLAKAAGEVEKLTLRCDELEEAVAELRRENFDTNLCIDDLYEHIEAEGNSSDTDECFDDGEMFDLYDDEDGLFEIMCPECGEDVIVDFDMLDDENNIVCPNCHHDIELEFDMDDESEDISD